jgi:catechol 2,3-dioxygenase-like lactoylglutathione lyase family enzyme
MSNPMEPRISLITLGVKDLQRSLTFYRDGLGFPTTWNPDQGVIFFKTTGTRLALYPYDSLATDISPAFAGERSKFPGITLAHNVRNREEVDEILKKAQAAGGIVEKPAQETFWGGYAGYFSDPDGYLWEIAFGAFPILDDGTLAIP